MMSGSSLPVTAKKANVRNAQGNAMALTTIAGSMHMPPTKTRLSRLTSTSPAHFYRRCPGEKKPIPAAPSCAIRASGAVHGNADQPHTQNAGKTTAQARPNGAPSAPHYPVILTEVYRQTAAAPL